MRGSFFAVAMAQLAAALHVDVSGDMPPWMPNHYRSTTRATLRPRSYERHWNRDEPDHVFPGHVDCPTCKAKAGRPCDARTLGRYPFHRSRVEAAKKASAPCSLEAP